MKAIGIKMVELIAMCAGEAHYKGYKTNGKEGNDPGYEVTYPDGYKSWCPKDVADKAYFKLDESNDGTKIVEADINRFCSQHKTTTICGKIAVVIAKTITGFKIVESSYCVDPKNYSQKAGETYAMKNVRDKVLSHLEFVLQWAKNGLYNDKR